MCYSTRNLKKCRETWRLPSMDPPLARLEEPLASDDVASVEEGRRRLLFFSYAVLFSRYCALAHRHRTQNASRRPQTDRRTSTDDSERTSTVGTHPPKTGIATFLSAFFTPVSSQLDISASFNGLIFAAYPSGMAITSLFAPQLIRRLGTRTAVRLGLVLTSSLTLFFGAAPDVCARLAIPDALEYFFLVAYFLNGLAGAVAETVSETVRHLKERRKERETSGTQRTRPNK